MRAAGGSGAGGESTSLARRLWRALPWTSGGDPLPRPFAGGPQDFLEPLTSDAEPLASSRSAARPEGAVHLDPGDRFGPFHIEAELGAGGMGTVYKARLDGRSEPVALKLARRRGPDETHEQRLENEAEVLARLDLDGVAGGVQHGELDGIFYLATRYVEGEDLLRWARRRKRTPREVLEVAAGIAGTLAECHARGIVHRDLSPSNILIRSDGRPVLVDFGLGHDRDESLPHPSLTQTDHVAGKYPYIPPEVRLGGERSDERGDIYSLGACLYAAWSREEFDPRLVHDLFPSMGERDDAYLAKLKLISRKCLAPDPRFRFPTARDLALELREALSPPPVWKGALFRGAAVTLILSLFLAAQFAGASPTAATLDTPIRSLSHGLHLALLGLFLVRSIWTVRTDPHRLELPRFMPGVWLAFLGYYAFNTWSLGRSEAWIGSADAVLSNLTACFMWLASCALRMPTKRRADVARRRLGPYRAARVLIWSAWGLLAAAAVASRLVAPDGSLEVPFVLLPSALFVGGSLCMLALGLGQPTLQVPTPYVLTLVGYGLIQMLYPSFAWIGTQSEGLLIAVYGFGMIGKLALFLCVESILKSWSLFGHEGQLSDEW